MSNFVLNKTIRKRPTQPEWLNRDIKKMLKKKNRIYKRCRKNGFKEIDKVPLDVYRKECAVAIEKSKQDYLCKLDNKLSDNCIGQKTYWKILYSLLNKCKIPRIPPLLIDNKFVTSCKEKVTFFNNLFLAQRQAFVNTSKLTIIVPLLQN